MAAKAPDRRPSAGLGAAIRRARAGRYSIAELARRSRTSVGLLSLIERGQGNPSFETLGRIAAALDLSLVQLLETAEGAGDQGRSGTSRSLVPMESAGLVTVGRAPETDPRSGDAEPGWQTSMILRHGQEARIRVLSGSLQLALRDAELAVGAAPPQPLAVDLEVRTATETAVVEIPPVDDPRWRALVDGRTPFQPTTLAARMLFTHVVRCVREDPSAPNVDRWVSELRGYFVKYETVSRDELVRIFG